MIRILLVAVSAVALSGCAALIPLALIGLEETPAVLGEVEALRRATPAPAPHHDAAPLVEPSDIVP